MQRLEDLEKNFRFIAIEVIKQVERTQRLLQDPDPHLPGKIKSRDDYIDHLKTTIENKSFGYLQRNGDIHKRTVDRIRSINVITANLERIADHAVNIVMQTKHYTDKSFLDRYDYVPFFEVIKEGLRLVPDAFEDSDAAKAVQISDKELELDELYRGKFERILAEMTSGQDVPNLITSLMIFHYLERMGDCLQNIGEAILLSRMGERMKINQYRALRDGLSSLSDNEEPLDDVQYEGIYGTKSGCTIGKLSEQRREGDGDQELIYKEGDLAKIKEEKEKIEKWGELFPSLPARVVEYKESDRGASLIYEYLKGSNLQEILFNLDEAMLLEAMTAVEETMHSVWSRTLVQEPVSSSFLSDLLDRLEDVLKVHPQFDAPRRQVCALEVPSFGERVRRNGGLDRDLSAPFTVFCHGDFNLDNVLYNVQTKQVHFIDVHRSGQMDYARDVAVFLVSNFRIPVFEAEPRDRINGVIYNFYRFARRFASENGDDSFQARLALGLVRSLFTSTRFELDREFATLMFSRAEYLLEKLEGHEAAWERFELPEDVLYH